MAFAERLREIREQKKMTQDQLAQAAGLSKAGIAHLEHGIREPSWSTIQKLADALGVTCMEFQVEAKDAGPRGRGRPPKADVEPAPEPKPAKGKKPKKKDKS